MDEDNVEPLATGRSRRLNAGSRMQEMMLAAEDDEVLAQAYGLLGTDDSSEDEDFLPKDLEAMDAEDDVDSDFSIDETDEIAPEHREVEEEPKKKGRAYRDPKPKGYSVAQTSGSSGSAPAQPRLKPSSSSALPQTPSKRAERSFRDSTRKKTEETIKNIQTGKKRKKKSRNLQDWQPLTQEEMLAEAKITEEENLRTLEIYQRLESEKLKKIKQVKKTLPPPYISYLSTTMPVLGTDKRYTRNFITCVQCDLFPKESATPT